MRELRRRGETRAITRMAEEKPVYVNVPTDSLDALAEAVDSFRWAGPGNVSAWEPGEDVDNDSIAADVIVAAEALLDAVTALGIWQPKN